MDKRTIQIVIILMSVALIGIAIIQFYWLKKGIELNAQNFNDKVTLALNNVKNKIESEADSWDNLRRSRGTSAGSIFKVDQEPVDKVLNSSLSKYRRAQLETQIANISWLIEPEIALNAISLGDLKRSLRVELQNQDIDLDYDYGVYSEKVGDYIITNDKYSIVNVAGQSSEGGTADKLSRSEYGVPLFALDSDDPPGYLRIFFPKKNSFLLKTILPALISSIFLTGLILFCFVYTINVILTQKQVSLMKTDFINNMTHEFKTPIATISLAADSMTNPMIKSNEKMIDRYADIIRQENKRMLTQVEKVLQIARLDKKDFQLKVSNINVNDLVNVAVENTRLRVNERGGTITTDVLSVRSTIKGDENHISNIIHNLLDNAVKYSAEAPVIEVGTRDVKGGIEILVKDSGIGMGKDDLKRIFEKFYRVSTGNLHDVKGFGLGLSYVKAITRAHRGKVTAESDLGKGSIFRVYLPHDFESAK